MGEDKIIVDITEQIRFLLADLMEIERFRVGCSEVELEVEINNPEELERVKKLLLFLREIEFDGISIRKLIKLDELDLDEVE